MDPRVILDEKSFKALSADSRINILKNLTDRRRTLTELSQKLNLGGSTIKEHCDILVNAELIKQIDEGRKWKYYELTPKGKQIIQPSLFEEVKVLVILSIATLLVGGFIYLLLSSFGQSALPMGALQTDNIMNATGAEPVLKTTALTTPAQETQMYARDMKSFDETISGISTEFFVASILISLIVGMTLGWVFTRRR